MLTVPVGDRAEVQVVDGEKYLVCRLDELRDCSYYLEELQKGRPVVVPCSKRGYLTGLLKEKRVFTRQRTVVPGQWITFTPCEERQFKP